MGGVQRNPATSKHTAGIEPGWLDPILVFDHGSSDALASSCDLSVLLCVIGMSLVCQG